MADTNTAPSPAFQAAFMAEAGPGAQLTFDRYMALALYHPEVGYYRQTRPRVGRTAGTDFYTASTSGSLFGELICAATTKLLSEHNLSEYTFIEIGAEPERTVLQGVQHPFGSVRTVRVGEPITLNGRCIVFSNELFDAQPFRRFVFREGRWHELGVRLENNRLAEVTLSSTELPAQLPVSAPEDYHLDLPLSTVSLIDAIAGQPWTGLFLAFDYGKSWRELIEVTPHGTARAYHRHAQSNDLLANPGLQDLTCHVCWDWLAEALAQHRFTSPQVESQEAFFIHHAADFIAATTAAEATRFSQKKLGLLQLLHPTNMGQKFQALWALRG